MSSPLLRQIFASVGVLCLNYTLGFLVSLQDVLMLEQTLVGHAELVTWIQTTFILASFTSQLFAGFLTNRFGRKPILFLSLVFPITTCLFIYKAEDFTFIFVAYLIAGLMSGTMALGPIYLAEISSPQNRGVLLSTKLAFNCLGILTGRILSKFIGWRTLAICAAIPSLLPLVTIFISPESPYWLAERNRFDECKKVFIWFRGKYEVEELDDLISQQKQKETMNELKASKNNTILKKFKQLINNDALKKALFVYFVTGVFIKVTGKSIFTQNVIDVLTFEKNNGVYLAVGYELFDVIGFCASCYFIKKYNRRALIFSSGYPSVFAIFLFFISWTCISADLVPQLFSWISLVAIIVFVSLVNVGCLPVMCLLQSEVFPVNYRGFGLSITSIFSLLLTLAEVNIVPVLIGSYGIHRNFMINGLFMTVCMIYMYYTVPETKDKSLLQIEKDMVRESKELPHIVVSDCDMDEMIENHGEDTPVSLYRTRSSSIC